MMPFKHSIGVDIRNQKLSPKARPPLRTIKEMAEELSTTPHSLAVLMSQDPNGPRPNLKFHGRTAGHGSNTWYEPGAVRKWWKARKVTACQT